MTTTSLTATENVVPIGTGSVVQLDMSIPNVEVLSTLLWHYSPQLLMNFFSMISHQTSFWTVSCLSKSASVQKLNGNVDVPISQVFRAIFSQKVNAAGACYTTIKKISKQKMYTFHIVQLKAFNLNAWYPLSIVFFSKQFLDFWDRQKISEPGILVSISNPKSTVTITALVTWSSMYNRSQW